MHRYTAYILAVLISLLFVYCGGSGNDADNAAKEKQIASDVARQWTRDKVHEVSADIAEAVTDGITQGLEPGVTTSVVKVALEKMASSVIEDQINASIRWTYSEPEKKADSQYEVVTTASVTIVVPIPLNDDKIYDASIDIRLNVDIENEEVTERHIDLSSVQFKEKEPTESGFRKGAP